MPSGRPDKKDLLLPDTLTRLRIAAGFRHKVDFAKATGFDPTKKRKGGLHPETIGHYERGERCPGEGMALYIAQQLISEKEPLADEQFMAAYRHDRPIWDAAEAAAKAAADAAAEDDAPTGDATEAKAVGEDQPTSRPTVTVITKLPPPLVVRGTDGRWHLLRLTEEPDDQAGTAAAAGAPATPQPPTAGQPPTPPPQPPRPPQRRSPRARRLWTVMAAVTAIVLIMVLAFNLRLPSSTNRHPVLVATLTRAVTATSIPTSTQVPTTTPTSVPTTTPTPVPTTVPTIAPTWTNAHNPGYNPSGSVTVTFAGPSQCDWNVVIKVKGFPVYSNLSLFSSASGHDCHTGAATHIDDGSIALCVANDGTCEVDFGYYDGCCAPGASSWTVIGSHQYAITDSNGNQIVLTASD